MENGKNIIVMLSEAKRSISLNLECEILQFTTLRSEGQTRSAVRFDEHNNDNRSSNTIFKNSLTRLLLFREKIIPLFFLALVGVFGCQNTRDDVQKKHFENCTLCICILK